MVKTASYVNYQPPQLRSDQSFLKQILFKIEKIEY